MRHLVSDLALGLLFVAWVMGTVLALGWWKLAALVFPFYAWYLVAERAMKMMGWVD